MTDLKDPKFWASICAWLVPISILVLIFTSRFLCWSVSETGTWIGSIASPLAGLSGFLYVYVSLIEQRLQNKRTENREIFNQFLTAFEQIKNDLKFKATLHDTNSFIDRAGGVEKFKDEVFDLLKEKIQNFYSYELDTWNATNFKKSTGRNHVKRVEINWQSINFEHAKTLVIAIAGDKFFGQYFKAFNFIIEHLRKSEMSEFLTILESKLGSFEKRFLFHYCPLMLPYEDVIFLKTHNFLGTVRSKHWENFFLVNFWNDAKFPFKSHLVREDI